MIYGIPPLNPLGKDNFAYWENFLSDEDINFILGLPEWHESQKARIGGAGPEHVVDIRVRDSNISWMHLRPETHHIWEKISKTIAEVNRQFFHFNITGLYEAAQLGIYKGEDQSHYTWHADSSMTDRLVPRKLSMALLLSDPSEFTGGELQIKSTSDTPVNLELKRGRAWFFPSYTLHRVAPVTSGIRRSLVIWAGGPAFK